MLDQLFSGTCLSHPQVELHQGQGDLAPGPAVRPHASQGRAIKKAKTSPVNLNNEDIFAAWVKKFYPRRTRRT